jgi:hypothetical protein
VSRVSVHAPSATTIITALLFTKIACVRHVPLPCRVCTPLFVATPRHYFTYALSIYIIFYYIYIIILYRIGSCVSRLRTFQLTGTLPYTGFTFDSPKHQSYTIYDRQSFRYIYISFDYSILPTFFRNFFATQVRRPNQSSSFGTIRYMQPALSPSFFSSSS